MFRNPNATIADFLLIISMGIPGRGNTKMPKFEEETWISRDANEKKVNIFRKFYVGWGGHNKFDTSVEFRRKSISLRCNFFFS